MSKDEKLVRVNLYSSKIKELPICKRISIDYPLFCRDSVARKISNVANTFPDGLYIQIDSAYRTRETQEYIWKRRNKEGINIVFNPNSGVPPHCTGGAIDVSLTDNKGVEINLSEPFRKYYEEPTLISDNISVNAQENRLLLNKIMLENGFAPNPREYWHFSYGDEAWASYYDKSKLYEEVDLPKTFYRPLYLRLFYRVVLRARVFLERLGIIKTNF